MERQRERILRAAFIAGAVTDALALIPMMFPTKARSLDPYPWLHQRVLLRTP